MPAVEKGKDHHEGEGAAEAVRQADTRIGWFEEVVIRNLKIKSDKWKKMTQIPECTEAISRFLDSEKNPCLLFYINVREEVVATNQFPTSLKRKSMYCLRKGSGPITQKVEQDLIIGDLASPALDHLNVLLGETFSSLFGNNKNLEHWPDVVVKDVMRHYHRLNSAVQVVAGQSKGKTQLPLPQTGSATEADKATLHSIETAIIDWTHQIKEVIKSDSSVALREGLNPGPRVELEFWTAKHANLKSIHEQLRDPKVQKIAQLLQAAKSSYYPAFQAIVDEVRQSLDEAADITKYMRAVKPYVENMSNFAEYAELLKMYRPMMHTFYLIWVKSDFYNTPTRLGVLLQEVCNDFITLSKNYLSPDEIFKSEAEDASEKLRLVLKVCENIKTAFSETRVLTLDSNRPWNFDMLAVFGRLDSFQKRVGQVLLLFEAIVDFNKLEKIDVGGTKGKMLTLQVINAYNEFTQSLDIFKKVKYDILDLKAMQFEQDFLKFNDKVDELDKRVATILCQAFDDCSCLASIFRLLEIFANSLSRPAVQKLFESKYYSLIELFNQDLDEVRDIFLTHRNSPPLHPNMPPVTGAVSWTYELRQRIFKTMEQFELINHPSMNSDEAKFMKLKYQEIHGMLEAFEQAAFNKWSSEIIDESEANLAKPLLVRDESNLLRVNFDPKVVALLKEIKYFEALQIKVPEKAKNVYTKGDLLRNYVLSLDHIVKQYNAFHTGLLPVEVPLVADKLSAIDKLIEKAITKLNWRSDSIQDYLKETGSIVGKLTNMIQVSKNNISQIENMMKNWYSSPVIERKDGKKSLNLEENSGKLKALYETVEKDGTSIHTLLKETCKVLECSEKSPDWQDYLKYVDQLIVAGLQKTIKVSLEYLLNNMTESFLKVNDLPALFESKIELAGNHLAFSPSFEEEEETSLIQAIKDLLDDMYKVSTMVPRVAHASSAEAYLGQMSSSRDLEKLRTGILDQLRTVARECQAYRDTYDQYAYLWTEDRHEYMKQFLVIDDKKDQSGEGTVNRPTIPLDKFEAEIKKFESIHKTVMALDNEVNFKTWLRVDAKPLKQNLNVVIKKWSYTFTKYLSDDTVEILSELNRFVKNTKKGLENKVQEGDYDGLINAMALLLAVKHRASDIDTGFEPLRKTANLLKQCGVDLNEDSQRLLNDLPEEWSNVKKLASAVREHVSPLQSIEVEALQKKANKFEMKNHQFREDFKKNAPFRFEVGHIKAYDVLDQMHVEVGRMEAEATALRKSADLFELTLPVYKQLVDCRREIGQLKNVWDIIGLVTYLFDSWKTTLWTLIDIDAMDAKCRDLSKELRRLDKEMKAWDVYIGLDQMVKDMIISLRAVGELRSNAIRDRHWKQLMATTGVTFVITEDMKFQDLLRLQLHKFEDEVKGIVDRATKELGMEKILSELDATWKTMEFTFEPMEGGDISLIKASEELVETLEDNQVMLQNLMTSKYVAHFLEVISKWQSTLSTVDMILTLWREVQQTWSHLENIFKGSEDIRTQLPEDTKRFDIIDERYRALMKESVNVPNCIQLCMREGLYDLLENLQSQLALCEKSLAEYLETKRLAFPRFYFVSGSDLLDILAKGTMPQKVQVHLPKLFDNIARLEFQQSDGPEPSKVAVGMYSKEDEYVAFSAPVELNGPVEVWLNRLVDTMRKTLRTMLGDAVTTYEEKPRDQWIFDNAAQITLAGTQIWWTTEVNVAFGRLEEGYENALKDYYKKQCAQLTNLITLIQGELSRGDRQMIMTVCTLDVHARDIVAKLIQEKAENAQCFSWQCQLRLRWDDDERDCHINICDAHFRYNYEYLGNTPRLVVTPLTDRCYITLTQALHLLLGGAPAGPAGTGKTETTKDLGRALAMMVYVFNCSDQMDYKSVGNIFKGLAQSGTWGCFDEFNRISVEVLSVIATQVKSIQDALRAKKKRFIFQGEEINLVSTVGYFITMNPGYAGRAELPENIKALFRPCSMVVPDLELICEIMLMAEGFVEASALAKKFTTLYKLNRELLSKQDHYDWGLRAIKSVLVVAGTLKRADPKVPEDNVLMRALRDFNIPKIVSDDLSVFLGLIGDLFPKIEIARKRNEQFEEVVRKATLEANLQPEDAFILKVVQLEELLAVRHCVFVLGNAGSGKSQIWKTLARAYVNSGRKCVTADLNPKAVTTDELFGYINQSTREWKDGLLSSIMRDMANMTGNDPKWIILDDNIDPNWIESLNTVMDDNKILTLASNERIPLKPHMRLIFEIGDLKHATPATVSRAGILFVNPGDLGWLPFVQSWLDKREDIGEKSALSMLFDRYVNPCLDALNSGRFKRAKVENFSMVQSLCNILEALLTPKNTPKGCDKEWFEIYFVFASIWAFGGSLIQDQLVDYRVEFSKWWNAEFKNIKMPTTGTVFDYFVDNETKKFLPWTDKLENYEHNPDAPLQSVLVPTSETLRIRYFLDLLADNQKPVLLVGGAGCGKSVIVQNKLSGYGEDRLIVNIPFNFYTTAWSLQPVMEKYLEKKAGRNYGPPGSKKLVYFIDDLNMPEVDKFSTVSPHCLLRQMVDYKHWYDRQKLTLKDIHNCQLIACMNPTSGSFNITPRLQRHFSVFTVNFPSQESLQQIYSAILGGHLSGFPTVIQRMSEKIINVALLIHKKVTSTFLPTAIKFHYIFNLRDLSNIFQGVLFSNRDTVKEPMDLIRLWLHETYRVYSDKMLDFADQKQLQGFVQEIIKKNMDDLDQTAINAQPLMYCHFANGMGDGKYQAVKDPNRLKRILEDSLEVYNETNPVMNLVLFEDAIAHIARISRIIEGPRGNALLVGVGGSGKQSLARLAAYLSSYTVFQITLRKGYSVNDLKTDIASVYMKAGLKNNMVFLMTDSQISDEKFLVLINDLLASGVIPGLLSDEEFETAINSTRSDAKALGVQDTREQLWDLFVQNVRKYLKIVLCFSPVGSALRNRSRKFPSIVNGTTIDWFHEWPEEALISVAARFIDSFELVPEALKEPITRFMASAHQSVNEVGVKYKVAEKRYTYTTPKSFLEFIKLYRIVLERKSAELIKGMERLENGLAKLQSTSSQVDDLKARLATQEVELKMKNEEANRLIERVAVDTEKVNKEKAIADAEERKVDAVAKEVGEKQRQCSQDLAAAEPALKAAELALSTLNKNNLTELKSFGQPPEDVKKVVSAVIILLSPPGKPAKDRSWKAGKATMGNVGAFLEQLITFDKEHIDAVNLKELQPYLNDPEFNAEVIQSKSAAAAGLCAWVINIVRYYTVYCDVEPKRKALEQANADLAAAQAKLADIQAKIADLNANLADLKAKYEKAVADKLKCEEDAKLTQETIVLANRLVGGLASEKVRWAEAVNKFKEQEKTLAGDVLLASAFLSYVGSFSKKYRQELWDLKWLPFIKQLQKIPISADLDPLSLLTNSADIAKWNNEGLPNDRVSLENATTMVNCKRWPLLIDPQLQGVTWVKNRFGSALRIVRLGARGYLDAIEKAVSAGDVVLLEDIGTWIDPVLDPLIGQNTIKKGKYLKLGDKEIEYDSRFRLILQTRLGNPHYPPEIQAQTTLINFTVTLSGLEDQLLVDVVNSERPDLERTKTELTKQQNEFKIKLTELEDNLLYRLSTAEGNFLGDYALVENLEFTKRTAIEVEQKVEESKKTEKKINETRDVYRPVAARSSLLYFLLNDLNQIHPMYQYSLGAYKVVFQKAIDTAESSEDVKERVLSLIDNITYCVWRYTTRGLFERDKLIFTAQMTFQIMAAAGELDMAEFDFLLRAPKAFNVTSPVDWINNSTWATIKALSNLEQFKLLANDIEGSAKRWQKYCEIEAPENEKLPQEWKNKTALERLCILRALRPDRMVYAVRDFVLQKMGKRYVDASRIPLPKSFEEAGPATPIFFVLSPGVDPVKEVEAMGRQKGFTDENGKFANVSLGQGQEVIAEQRLEQASKNGGWVMLENIHLVAKWLPVLEKKLETISASAHPDYRVFLSAEPAADPAFHIIPITILQSSIKITNEPPTGMQANIHRALDNFNQSSLERCSKENEFKAILFALCYFHAVVLERRKFGTQGWNRPYPFSTGDLVISVDVLYNYLETFVKVPWTDLRYIFGEIMYGGHISDDWDRRLCSAYLEVYMRPEMLEGQFELAPGFISPPSSDYKDYHGYIDDNLPTESPTLYGLHPNAEINVQTKIADRLFQTMLELQPKENVSGQTVSREEKVKQTLDEMLEKLPESFNTAELIAKVEERTPYINVAIQECDRMALLTNEIRRSLKELDLGLKGDLTITEAMDSLMNSLFFNLVPASWERFAYPSLNGLALWFTDLLQRIKELESWVSEFQMPSCVWIAGLFNPQSFLTAIMQSTARKNEWPLDKMTLTVDVMKKNREEVTAPPREGAYIHGLYMEGARWDLNGGAIADSLMKELTPTMPVIYVKAITVDKKESKGYYECPLYRTRQRGPTYVWTFNLKTKDAPTKWILAGVALLLSPE